MNYYWRIQPPRLFATALLFVMLSCCHHHPHPHPHIIIIIIIIIIICLRLLFLGAVWMLQLSWWCLVLCYAYLVQCGNKLTLKA